MLEAGSSIAGYRVDGVLGQGGMGVVYEATQLSLNRTVALKVLAAHLGEDPAFRERFRREGLLQAAIDHPHIVTVYEAGEVDGVGLFLAMRMVRGPNLKDMILSRELDAGRALRILRPLADALDSAHETGLIHRDIKPQNILVGGRDHAYLADFGLTKAPGEKSLTKTGQFVGTLDYISPEQIRGKPATTASDIYALAAVLYECLTGVVPYPKDSEAAVLYAHMSDPPPRVTDERPELPVELDEVLKRAMSKDPDERYPSAGALLEAAERAFGRKIRAAITPPGPLESPEETGIRAAERDIGTREARAQDTDELAAGTTAVGGPGATQATPPADATRAAAAAPDATRAAPVSDATSASSTPPADATRATSAPTPGATRMGSAPPAAPPVAQRPPVGPPPGAGAPAQRGVPAGLLAALGAAVLVAAVIGFVLGGSGGKGKEEPEGTNSASSGNVGITYPQDWERLDDPPDIPGIEFRDPVAVGPADDRDVGLVAGQVAGSGPTLLPSGFLERLSEPPARDDAVELGELQAYRYRGLEPRGFNRRLTFYAAPTSEGVAAIGCYAPAAQAAAFMDQCERVAASLELSGAEPRPLGPSEDYAKALDGVLGRLNSARASGRDALGSAARAPGQAQAARRIAGAYGAASGALRRAPAGPAEAEVNAELVAALADARESYERLSAAAQRGDRGAYRTASNAVRMAEQRVQRALADLKDLGYRLQ